jgi:hypothetical protein
VQEQHPVDRRRGSRSVADFADDDAGDPRLRSDDTVAVQRSTSASVWYGGNKTLEEILKNVFDQFNNQDAFGSF